MISMSQVKVAELDPCYLQAKSHMHGEQMQGNNALETRKCLA